MFLYNTGARVQETVDLKTDELRFETPTQAKLLGKGNKERACPLWPETVTALRNYLDNRDPATSQTPYVFLNAKGQPITRFGIRYIIRQYVANAAHACPSLKSKKVSPHTVRHATAMHLLQSGNDISVVKDWLGHATINTTHGYVEIDIKMKRKALEACQPPNTKSNASKQPKWLKQDILTWLDNLSRKSEIMSSYAAASGTKEPCASRHHRRGQWSTPHN